MNSQVDVRGPCKHFHWERSHLWKAIMYFIKFVCDQSTHVYYVTWQKGVCAFQSSSLNPLPLLHLVALECGRQLKAAQGRIGLFSGGMHVHPGSWASFGNAGGPQDRSTQAIQGITGQRYSVAQAEIYVFPPIYDRISADDLPPFL